MNFRSRVNSASVFVELPDKSEQSGWFFTSAGEILSAGHGLKNISNPKGATYAIRRGNIRQAVELLDYQTGETDELDFAIFRIKEVPSSVNEFVPMSCYVYTGIGNPAYEAFLSGFAASKARWFLGFTVKIEGLTGSESPGAKQRMLLTGPDLDAVGMSGGAVCLDRDDLGCGAIGLQVRQPDRNNSPIYAAQPLSDIFRASKVFKELLQKQWEKDKNYQWPFWALELKLLEAGAPRIGERRRFAMFVRNYDVPTNSKIFSELQQQKAGIDNSFLQSIRELTWLDPKILSAPLRWEFLGRGWRGNRPTRLQALFENRANLSATEAAHLRMIADLTRQLEFDGEETIRRASGCSHVVGVQFSGSSPTLRSDGNAAIDLLAIYPVSSQESAIRQIRSMLEDVLLDACIFHGIPVLRRLFGSADGAHAFSLAKVDYIFRNQERLLENSSIGETMVSGCKLSGLDLVPLQYISLTSIARAEPGAGLDKHRLRYVWEDFTAFLLPALRERREGLAPTMNDQVVVSTMIERRLFGGQMSRRRLLTALDRFPNRPGGLYAISFLKKIPKARSSRQTLRRLFDRKRVGAIKLFHESELNELCSLLPYVEFHLFRRD